MVPEAPQDLMDRMVGQVRLVGLGGEVDLQLFSLRPKFLFAPLNEVK